MKTKFIVLRGPANAGKTTTLKLALASLESRDGAVSTRLIDGVDVRAIIVIGDLKIAVESQGDPGGRLAESLDLFLREGCHIIICATRTSGATVDAVKTRSAPENVTWINKRPSVIAGERSSADAAFVAEILKKVP